MCVCVWAGVAGCLEVLVLCRIRPVWGGSIGYASCSFSHERQRQVALHWLSLSLPVSEAICTILFIDRLFSHHILIGLPAFLLPKPCFLSNAVLKYYLCVYGKKLKPLQVLHKNSDSSLDHQVSGRMDTFQLLQASKCVTKQNDEPQLG